MRFATASFVALAVASSAVSQTSSPLALAQQLLLGLSSSCQATVIALLSPTSPLFSCVQADAILPIILANGSIIPGLDTYLAGVCSGPPCDNATLTNASSSIITGCASDLASAGITNATVTDIFELYPLARELVCLKTDMPFNGTNATIPITSSEYNQTNGTFCVTSVLTEVSAYLGANLTNPFVDTLVLGGNSTALNLLGMIPHTALCSDCIYAGVDLIEEQYPQLGSISIAGNMTVNQYLDGVCNATGLQMTMNGTLPSSIEEVAVNSTYAFNVTAGNVTYTPSNDTSAPPDLLGDLNATQVSEVSSAIATATGAAGNVTTMKKRWLGQI